jgi:DNA-directed RNA polymerase specialized sigma24 family protein
MDSGASMSSMESAQLRTTHSIYVDHHAWLVAWLRRRLGCMENAQDLAQDTFLRVLRRPDGLAQAREPRAWLTTVAQGLVVDHALLLPTES